MPFDDDDDALAIRKTLGEAIQEAWRITHNGGLVTVDASVNEAGLRCGVKADWSALSAPEKRAALGD